ncbi:MULTISPECIES: glucosamine-6-phosphate deaminase [unclassified Frigoribacterium]|uniref:glucosamine-6-phosphate deaminase n=1 Tax=unclassified Frigoribacterium TaxID=2627005 RepID=UPI0006F472A5|nr:MULTISPECIES: glucosamine-6-phosphate deaminase [unclassified Frigoribacterium]KQO47842.1 glucosamine-6-phosphate deaminase [Frigoribacterium sp. Leaf254]KQT39935.1 glucosamine-6-phosphate deaminase [Frigoribacterium sp. Leaf415]
MEIIIVRDSDEVGRVAALKIASVVQREPEAVLGLATGSSPTGIYASLAARVAAGELDFGRASGFALDEYVGIPLEHPESYASVIERDVVVPLGMDASKVRVPDGRASDIEAAVVDYEQAIVDAGGIDIQILGIGANGHIGFNEPTSSFASRTRIKTLAPQTRADNARFFDDPSQVPTHCLTQGLGTILDAHEVVLVAQGTAKAAAVAGMVEGPLSAMCPGSALQLHRHATIVVDEAAAADLQLADYYRYTYANKPVWQRFE